ncbi:hypothetical protein ACE1B6_28820 [Aerosakkonemataceae cyanobacterium BLCC-F154]|uniref:Tetratricopeptide repeat protein n=1 Tax=Floridaenema fluviatile BLCC-F154 TaxID=3153640 RepID=A0ABV4YKB5_9CYAN
MQVTDRSFSWYDVPADVKDLLVLAAKNWHNTGESEKYINEALAKTDNPEVLVTAYRYFVYKYKYPQALRVAEKVMNIIKDAESFPDDWEELKPILLSRSQDPQIRLFLNAYAASGFVLAKMGELEKAKVATARVKEVDLKNEFGAAIIFDILTRPPEEED